MLNPITKAAAACVLILAMQAPVAASARTYHHSRAWYAAHHSAQHHARVCRNRGTALGVVGGAVLGNVITHGSTGGTIIGAGVGGVAGHSIAQSNCRRR